MENNFKTDTQAERLALLVMRLKITTRDLSKMIGLNENTLYKINSGSMAISKRTAAKICYFLEQEKGIEINRQWLLTGEGEMLVNNKQPVPYDKDKVPPMEMAAENDDDAADYKEKYFALLVEHSRLQAEYSGLLKKMIQQ